MSHTRRHNRLSLLAAAVLTCVFLFLLGEIQSAGSSSPLPLGPSRRQQVSVLSGPYVDSTPALVSPDGGVFTCDFGAIGWDITAGQYVAAWYLQSDNNTITNSFVVRNRTYLPLLLR